MFSVHCRRHGSEVLLTTDQIQALYPTSEGIEIEWRCWCGEIGRRPARPPRTPMTLPVAS